MSDCWFVMVSYEPWCPAVSRPRRQSQCHCQCHCYHQQVTACVVAAPGLGQGPGDVLVPLAGPMYGCWPAALPACLSVSVTACLSGLSGWLVGKHCLSCRLLVLCMLLNIVVSLYVCRLADWAWFILYCHLSLDAVTVSRLVAYLICILSLCHWITWSYRPWEVESTAEVSLEPVIFYVHLFIIY